jgi:hypothetical protein
VMSAKSAIYPEDDDWEAGADKAADKGEPTTWEPQDLGPYLRGEIEQPHPTLGLVRSDGARLIYPGLEHAVIGETESGKTWLALASVAAELRAGNNVVYIHFEEPDPVSTIERLRMLQIFDDDIIAKHLRFVAPAQAVRPEWLAPLLEPAPTLVIHDGVNEAMALLGAEIKAAEGAAEFRRRMITPFLRVGAATLGCDHLPMGADPSRRDAYGSVHKGNALNGARILLENTKPFGRGMRGVSHVFITKDRPGYLRLQGRPTDTPGKTFMGTLTVDAETLTAECPLQFWAPKAEDIKAEEKATIAPDLAPIVYEVIVAAPERTVESRRRLFARMRDAGHCFRDVDINRATEDLLVSGQLEEVAGKNRAIGFRAL